jgi:hypothetical protein
MKLQLTACFFAIAICGMGSVFAQESLVGKYTGNYEVATPRGNFRVGVTLVIDGVEDGKVKGAATLHQGNCRGDYPLEGTVKDEVIGLRSTAKGGPAGDCGFGFKGKVEGNRLVGNMGKYEVEFRK